MAEIFSLTVLQVLINRLGELNLLSPEDITGIYSESAEALRALDLSREDAVTAKATLDAIAYLERLCLSADELSRPLGKPQQ